MDRHDNVRSTLVELGTVTRETRGAIGSATDQRLNQPVPGLADA